MMMLWPNFQRPFFIILLPIMVYLLWKLWRLNMHRGSWQTIIPTIFQPWLLRGTQSKQSIIPKLLLTLASFLALLALLGPSWVHIKQPPLKLDAPLVIVVDMTPLMLATDMPPNRLENVKHKLLDIISERKDAQTAIIVYAGSAHVVAPLSDDKETLENLIKVLSPTIMPKQGNNAETGIAKAIQLIDNTRQNNKTNKAEILLVTTGLNKQEQSHIKKLLAGKSIHLDILGVGSSQGAPILVNGTFLKDTAGNIINPKLDISNLQEFAYSEGGYYSTMTLNNMDIEALHLANPTGSKRLINEKDMQVTDSWQDQGYWFVLPILLIAAFAGRKGWLLCIPLLVLTFQPQAANAYEWNKLWLNKNQQGHQLLQENNPKAAAKTFQDKQWKGYAAYEAKNYQKAEKAFANEKTPEGIYNYGNTLARQGKYEEAIAAWDKAIADKPNFEQAITNKKMVEDFLKKQAQEQPQQDSEQNNQQQNQGNSQQPQNSSSDQQQGNSSSNSSQDNHQPEKGEQANSEQQTGKQQDDSQNQQQSTETSTPSNTSPDNSQNSTQPATNMENDNNTLLNSASSTNEGAQQNTQQQTDQKIAEQQDKQPSNDAKNNSLDSDGDIEKQEQEDRFKQRLPKTEDPSELLRRKFYFEQRYNKGDY